MAKKKPAPEFTKGQLVALRLLGRGGARYGTRHAEMTELRDMGLAYAHDKGANHLGGGRWVWRPTDAGKAVIQELSSVAGTFA